MTRRICEGLTVRARLLPATDDRLRTQVETTEGTLDFQEYFVAKKCEPEVRGISFEGEDVATPAPGVIESIHEARAPHPSTCAPSPIPHAERPTLARHERAHHRDGRERNHGATRQTSRSSRLHIRIRTRARARARVSDRRVRQRHKPAEQRADGDGVRDARPRRRPRQEEDDHTEVGEHRDDRARSEKAAHRPTHELRSLGTPRKHGPGERAWRPTNGRGQTPNGGRQAPQDRFPAS